MVRVYFIQVLSLTTRWRQTTEAAEASEKSLLGIIVKSAKIA